MSKFDELRAKHQRFIYHSFDLNEKYLEFHFSIDDFHFYPKWTFDIGAFDTEKYREMAFSLGLAELISYWKCACCPIVEIRCGGLSERQKKWWKTLYWGGLAEFFYRNGISTDFEGFMTIEAPEPALLNHSWGELSGVMVPVGGGKDSVVSLEILRQAGERITPYVINPRPATEGCVQAAQIPLSDAIFAHRSIDPTLLELNAQGYLNGHTPFSAVVAFSSLLFGSIKGLRYIALSNESSANETYVSGAEVNHQYSKSTKFERDFREYCTNTFGDCPQYFSLLRPLTEWQIAREFVKYPQYFGIFQSCNLGSKRNMWCCNCAKCLYVYILLAAFLDDEQLSEIFGCNMLEKAELSDMLDGLVMDGEDKPFECVGTKDEVRLSLQMALERRSGHVPPLLERFHELFPNFNPVNLTGYFDKDNFVPKQFLPLLEAISNEH